MLHVLGDGAQERVDAVHDLVHRIPAQNEVLAAPSPHVSTFTDTSTHANRRKSALRHVGELTDQDLVSDALGERAPVTAHNVETLALFHLCTRQQAPRHSLSHTRTSFQTIHGTSSSTCAADHCRSCA
eukprot:227181-Rhodomonas_salina.2